MGAKNRFELGLKYTMLPGCSALGTWDHGTMMMELLKPATAAKAEGSARTWAITCVGSPACGQGLLSHVATRSATGRCRV